MTVDESNWQSVRFGDVVREVTEIEPDPLTRGITRYVGLADLDPDSIQIKRWGEIADSDTTFTRLFRQGQMLFGRRRAYQRKAALAPFDGICSGDIIVMEAKPDKLLPELLPFLVHTDGFFAYALRTSAGSLSPRTKWSHLAQYEFALPPLDEQRRIAEILAAAEDTNRNWDSVLEDMRKLRDALSFELFMHHAKEIPEIKCSELCDEITVGIVVRPASYYVDNGGVPTLRSLNVFPNRYDLNELVYLSQEGHIQHSKSQLRKGDLVVVRTGRPGDAAVVNGEVDGFNCIDLIIVRTSQVIRPHYLMHFLNSAAGRTELTRLTAGTAQQHLNVSALNNLKIPVRSLEAQDFIVKQFGDVDTRIDSAYLHLQKGVALKKSLLSQMLSPTHEIVHV